MRGTVGDLLGFKDEGVFSVHPNATVMAAVNLMNDHNVGSVVVMNDDVLVGIFTERDVLTRVVGARASADTFVADVMTKQPNTVSTVTPIADVMRLMSQRRCRHFPVVDDGEVVGLVSIGDITRHMIHTLEEDVESLHNYVNSGAAYPFTR
jgi:CBS domain-containing protein